MTTETTNWRRLIFWLSALAVGGIASYLTGHWGIGLGVAIAVIISLIRDRYYEN